MLSIYTLMHSSCYYDSIMSPCLKSCLFVKLYNNVCVRACLCNIFVCVIIVAFRRKCFDNFPV